MLARTRRSELFLFAALAVLTAGCERAASSEPGRAARLRPDSALWQRMLEAEDARGTTEAGIDPLIEGLTSANAEIRRVAVRALGRLETDSLIPRIAPLLEDSSAAVRAEAANALAQAARRGGADTARPVLQLRFREEPAAAVRGVIAESLGRLRHDTAELLAATLNVIAAAPLDATSGNDGALRLGIARALYFLLRQPAARAATPEVALTTLRQLIRYGRDNPAADTLTARRVRTVAAAALAASGAASAEDVTTLMGDGSPLVRREAVLATRSLPDAVRMAMLDSAASDGSPIVRYEALRARRPRPPGTACPEVLAAARDADAHVRHLAITMLGDGCASEEATALLDSLAATLPPTLADTASGWQSAARALVSLAATDTARARVHLDAFTSSANPFVRMYSARAAGLLRDAAVLRTLAFDVDANVRTEAITRLFGIEGRAADSVLIAQLSENDSQLLQAAADSLRGSRHARALPTLLDAFDRISSARRETWRDARVALLARIAELGSRAQANRLQPYLQDYDALIANRVADVLAQWTGARPQPAPKPLPRLALPSFDRLAELENAVVIMETSAGTLELRLLPFDAPTNAWRFARLAREGYYNGLTFHRVEPNFVLQGGSPGANEYAGDGPYTRDELGLVSNSRGTVGLSTRGRDTGDAQIYVNLIDNVRLDHDYTVFAEIVGGHDVMDRVVEGTRIQRITIRPAAG